MIAALALALSVHLSSVSQAGTFTFPVQSEQVVVGASTGIAAAQTDDGIRETLSEVDLAADTSSAPSPSNVRVQNGSATLGAAATSVDVTIGAVVMAQSFLTFSASFDDVNPGGGQVSGWIVDPTTLRFERSATGPIITVKWYTAEFVSGVTVQRGTANMTAALLDIPITAVNLARSFPIISYRIAGGSYGDNDFLRAKLTSTTNLQITVSAGTGGSCEWQVIEYTGAAVQSGDLSFAAGDASRSATVAAVNVPKTWLLFSYASASGTGTNIAQKMLWGTLTDATTLTFDRASTGQAVDVTWYLVEFTDATTVESGSTQFTTAQTQLDVPIVCVDTLTSLATAGGMSYRGGSTPYTTDDNPGVSSVTLDLTSATNLRLTRGLTGAVTASIGWFVVRFAGYLGCRISGSYPGNIASEDGTFIRYREGLSSSTNHYPGAQTITTGANCGGTFPSDLRSSNDGDLCLRESPTGTIAFDASSSTSGSAASFTFAHATTGANRLLVVGVAIRTDAGQTVTSITYSGSALTFVRADTLAASVRSELWYRIAPATGSNNVVVTLSASAKAAVGAISLTGVAQTAPVDAQNGATGTSATPTETVTTVTDGAWVVDALAFRSTGAGTPTGNPGGGQTQRWSQYNEGGGTATNIRGKGSTEGPRSPAGAVVMDWALAASVDWAVSGIAVQPADDAITVRHDFAAVPAGDAYDVCVEAYILNAAGESMLLQVLTPPAAWATRITVVKTADNDADQCYTMTAAEYNGGSVSIRWIGGTETGESTASDLRIDHERIVRRFTNYRLDARYDWAGVPVGDAYALIVKGYRTNEDVTVQVLTPPATWNARITVNSVANQVFSYSLTPGEYNGGSPSVRFIDAVPAGDAVASDLFLDAATITTLHFTYSLEVRQNIFHVHAWNFTSGAWDLLMAAPFTAANAYHNVSLAPPYLSAGTVRLRYVDAAVQDTIGSALSLDFVAVAIINDLPVLTNDGVSPTSGDITTSFTFFVRYSDTENNAPSFVNLTLNGVPYAMVENNSADTNYVDGKDYFLVQVIGVRGTLNFFFSARAVSGDTSLATTAVRQVSVQNRLPTISNGIASDAVHTGRPYGRDFNGTDLDNDTLAWSFITNASWLSMGPVNGTIWGAAPSTASSFYVDVIAGDGFGGSASDNYTLSVTNAGPTITNSIASDGVHTSRPYVRDFNGTDPEGDALLWSLSTNASWLSLGPANGTVWGVAPSAVGSYYVDLGLSDGFGGSASDNYTLSVGNLAPTISNPLVLDGVHMSRPYLRDFNGTDPDGDTLAWSMSTNASWLAFGPANGTVWGIAPSAATTYYVDIGVADGFGGSASNNYTLSVGNLAPAISNPLVTVTAFRRASVAIDFNAFDADADILSWSLQSNATFLSVGSANGTVSGLTPNVPSRHWVEVTVSDGFGGTDIVNFTFIIVNRVPQAILTAPAAALENDTYQGTFSGTDADGDTLSWTLATNAAWLAIDPVNGTLRGTASAGVFFVNVTARDPFGGVSYRNITLTVSRVVPPPPPLIPPIVAGGLTVLTLAVSALAIAVVLVTASRRRRDLEQALLLDPSGKVRMRYDSPAAPFSEVQLLSLLEAQDRTGIEAIPADPHTLHLVRRKEGEWILVSKSKDTARVTKAAEPLFTSVERDWIVHVPIDETPAP